MTYFFLPVVFGPTLGPWAILRLNRGVGAVRARSAVLPLREVGRDCVLLCVLTTYADGETWRLGSQPLLGMAGTELQELYQENDKTRLRVVNGKHRQDQNLDTWS